MRIFVINLDRSTERMRRMDGLMRRLGLDYTRIAAVEGKALSEETVRNWPVRAGCGRPRGEEIATILSHAKCWEAVAGGDGSYGLVLEDDVVFARNFVDLLADPRLVSGDPDMVRLEAWPIKLTIGVGKTWLNGGYRRHRMHDTVAGSAGYLISPAHAAWMLSYSRVFTAPIDLMLYSSEVCDQRKITAVLPGACIQYQHMAGSLPPLDFMGTTMGHVDVPKPTRKTLSQKIAAEVRRTAQAVRRALRGQMRARHKLHRAGPMEEV